MGPKKSPTARSPRRRRTQPPPGMEDPSSVSPSDPYIVDPIFKKLLEYLVMSAMRQFGFADYVPPSDLKIASHFALAEAEKVFKISVAQTELWYPYWKAAFRSHYRRMVKDKESYMFCIFKGLNTIHSRKRLFYENLIAGHSFVYCATVYFCYNGWKPALLQPLRALETYFNYHLRIPFKKAGAYRGLSDYCRNHDFLKLFDMYFDFQNSPFNINLEKDVKPRMRTDIEDMILYYDYDLSQPLKPEDSEPILQVMAWFRHKDLDSQLLRKRIIGNEWKYKDTRLTKLILKRMDKKQPPRVPKRSEKKDEEDKPQVVEPLLDLYILRDLKLLLEEFNTNIFDLEKMAESLLE